MFTKAEADGIRPRRGRPDETRQRLVRAAADAFNQFGYTGTDVRRIVGMAGYATGTFYKHFSDKGAALIAAYDAWVADQWRAYSGALATAENAVVQAESIVAASIELHSRWRGLTGAMAAYVMVDDAAASAYRQSQRAQIDILRKLRATVTGDTDRPTEADVLIVMLVERAAEGMATNEPAALGLNAEVMRALLVDIVADAIDPPAEWRA